MGARVCNEPLRFIGEALGYTVKWIPSTERILITDVPAILKSNRSILTCEDIMLLMSIMETDLESILSYLSVVLPAYDYFFYENNSIFGDKFEIFKESISTSEIELLYEFLSNLYISEACADGAIELLVVATLLQEADSFPEEAHNKMMLSIEQNSPDFTEDVETAIEQLAEFAKKIESLVVELEESGVDISL